ncbi:MAG: 4'-phosphopantetheinyl transferase superfamily protein [Clostridia bacterium]|nr:4'-phosphopantetheinyl transferase superfamily protein [Clostridia bacterium]
MKRRIGSFTDVYLIRVAESPSYKPVLPKERQALHDATQNVALKAERYAAWNALLAGLERSAGIFPDQAGLRRTDSGKWVTEACGISISHCKTAAAAAVSPHPVGVDIEPAEDARYREALLDRIASDAERETVKSLPTGLGIAAIWTRKEAAFKQRGDGAFSPGEEDAANGAIRTVRIRLDRDYVVSVAGETDRIRVFEVTDDAIVQRTDYETIVPPNGKKQYVVYMLRCKGDRLYTGITTDPVRRFSEHEGKARGAKYTHAFPPEGIAAAWKTDSRALALKLEARIKKLTRAQKNLLIETNAFDAFKGAIAQDAYKRIEV